MCGIIKRVIAGVGMKRKRGFSPSNLRDARLRTGKTQEEMAAELGIAQTQYSRYENGMAEPGGALVKHMALKMRVTTDYLFGLVGEPRDTLTFSDLSAEEQRLILAYRSTRHNGNGGEPHK